MIDNPLVFSKKLEFKCQKYRYPSANNAILNDIDLKIFAGTTGGFSGATGSGKTTLSDLLTGILHDGSSKLSVDGSPSGTLQPCILAKANWLCAAKIYLTDDTIAANIAFGVPKRTSTSRM